jgi:hypothetical protein
MAVKAALATTSKQWSAEVARRPPALDLEPGVFTWSDPRRIAASLLASAQRSTRRKRSVYASAMAMLCFYVNRAGRNPTNPSGGCWRQPRKSSAYGQAANGAGVTDAPGNSGSCKQISPSPRLRNQSAG